MQTAEVHLYTVRVAVEHYGTMTWAVAASDRDHAEHVAIDYIRRHYVHGAPAEPCNMEILGVMKTEKVVLVETTVTKESLDAAGKLPDDTVVLAR